MRGNVVMAATAGFLLGTLAGFILGKRFAENDAAKAIPVPTPQETLNKETPKQEIKQEAVKADTQHIQVNAAQIATPEKSGINYTDYCKRVEELKYMRESQAPTDGDSTEDVDEIDDDIEIEPKMETYEEMLDRQNQEIVDIYEDYKKKKGDRIDVLGKHPVDHDYPDIHYDEEVLYYLIGDDTLCDDMGNILDHNGENLIGNKLARFGWFRNGEEDVWVRNNKIQTDFHIEKIDSTYAEYFDNSSNIE